MDIKHMETEFRQYLERFQKEPELAKILNKVTFPDLFNEQFLQTHSKWNNMDDLVFKGDFGIMNLLEVENVNPQAWDKYISDNTPCYTWHQFGKLAMLEWMRQQYKTWKESKK